VKAKNLQNICHEAVILGGEGAVAVVDELPAAVWLAINAAALQAIEMPDAVPNKCRAAVSGMMQSDAESVVTGHQ